MAGFVKSFGVSFDYVLYDLSYVNLLMYSSTLPSYETGKKGKNGGESEEQEVVRADDVKNRENVLAIIRGQKF